MDSYRTISINLSPAKSGLESLNFFEEVQAFTVMYTKKSQHQTDFEAKNIYFSWYSDAPVSEGISISVHFSKLEGVDFVKDLVIAYRNQGYIISGIVVGY